MKKVYFLVLVALVFSFQSKEALSCEKLKSYSNDELKEYRDVLIKMDADLFDRITAFKFLVCSNNPNIRAYAVTEGLKKSSDPLLRNQILLNAMMQKKRIDIELASQDSLTKKDKEFIAKHAGVYSTRVRFSSEEHGCLGFSTYKAVCYPDVSLYVQGDKVEFNYNSVVGEFRLSQTGELVGYLRPENKGGHSRIPAIIRF